MEYSQFGHIQSNIKRISAEIDHLQCGPVLLQPWILNLLFKLRLQEQLLCEEQLWKQKSRELWLTCKDLNTKFFHASTVNRRRFNSVPMLKNNSGQWLRIERILVIILCLILILSLLLLILV
jgi:hypothetical protein